MTTSSSERSRCTRISPSAVIDDRLEGNDLEWALDHLKECDVCRDRIEEFREIVVRVDRLPLAPIPPAIVRDAYSWAIPEGLRTDPELAFGPPEGAAPPMDLPPRPAPFELPPWEMPATAPTPPSRSSRSLTTDATPPVVQPPPLFPPADLPDTPVHEVAFDSRRPDSAPVEEEEATEEETPGTPDARHEARVATMTRVAVGLVAAACVLLAGLLYADGGLLTAFRGRPAPSHTPSANVKSSTAASITPSPSSSPSPSASATPAATVLASLGDGTAGERVWRIRVGTADPAFTRIVFDMQGPGLPAITVTQSDTLHLVVTFKDATGPGLATGGIQTVRVAGLEPAVQHGSDLVVTIDLARPIQLKAFTLTGPARLVLDLY